MYKSIILLFAFVLGVASCNESDKYKLKWKPKKNTPLYYKITKNIVHDKYGNQKENQMSFDVFGNLFFDAQNIDEYALLSRKNRKEIDLVFVRYHDVPFFSERVNKQDLIALLKNGVSSKLTFDNHGNIINGYLNNSRRDFVSVMFELPVNKVGVDDYWKLSVNLINRQGIMEVIDTQDNNEVVLSNVRETETGKVAVMRYNLKSYLVGTVFSPQYKLERINLLVQLKCIAEFNINDGYLVNLSGLYSVKQSGFQRIDKLCKFEVTKVNYVPDNVLKLARGEQVGLSREEINRLISKLDTVEKPEQTADTISSAVEKKSIAELERKAPPKTVSYKVQILAAKNKVPLNSELFKGIDNHVVELIEDNQEYKYNYVIDKNCSYKEAVELRNKMICKGFKDAFIIRH